MSRPTTKRIRRDPTRPAHNKACARCRTRKIKCDGLWPACSSCRSAQEVCVGFDTTLAQEVPRSITAHLEGRVLDLERKLRAVRQQGGNEEESSTLQRVTDRSPSCLRSRMTAALTGVVEGESIDSDDMFLYYSAFHLQQSSLPLPFPPQTRYPSREELSGRSSPKAMDLAELPRTAADLMLKHYRETLLWRHPCVGEQELLQSYMNCFDNPDKATSFDTFIVCMALAISAATLVWKSQQHALSASARFFAKAREMLALPTTHDTEIRRIQVALLMANYSFTNPTAVDAWYCIGDASRRCISLGLHKEPDAELGLSPEQMDARRRLFWTTCGLERTICSSLRLPFLFDESDITLQIYCPIVESPARSIQWQSWNHNLEFRLLETEVYSMLWLRKEPYTSIPHEQWLVSFNARIDDWCSRARMIEVQERSVQGAKHIFELGSLGQTLLKARLNRPTPRVMYPSQQSRLEFIKAAMSMAEHYSKYCQQRRLIYPWFAAHNLFEVAIATLDTAWLGSDWLPQYVDIQQVINTIHEFPRLLREVEALWPAVRTCADTVAKLVEPVVQRLEAIRQCGVVPARNDATSNIIACYLFPDSPLAAEERTVRTDDTGALGFEDFVVGNFEDFDWATVPLDPSLFTGDFI